MGLGKTYLGSEALKRFDCDTSLIVCQKSKIDDWTQHMKTHYTYEVFDLTKDLSNFLECETQKVGVINYDLIHRRAELLKLNSLCIVLDESSLIQNEQAKRTKFIFKLKAKHFILLSGTVINGNYEKLWSQMRLLGWDISKSLFWDRFVVTRKLNRGGFWIDIPTGQYRRVDELKETLAEHGAIFMKTEEVYSLPAQVFSVIKVKATTEYRKFVKERIVEVAGDTLIGDTPLNARLHERMLCSSYSKYKLEAYKDILDSTDDRLIVFYCFQRDLAVLKAATDRPTSIVNGTTHDLAAYKEHSNSVTFIQWQAGSMGLNLQLANKMVIFNLPDGWAEGYMQALKRIHRIGQERSCFYYVLETENSIEQDIKTRINEKKERCVNLFEHSEISRGLSRDIQGTSYRRRRAQTN